MVSYTTVSPLPPDESGGGLFSVALSRGSPRVGVTDHPALRSPDLPRRARRTWHDAAARPTRPLLHQDMRPRPGDRQKRAAWRRCQCRPPRCELRTCWLSESGCPAGCRTHRCSRLRRSRHAQRGRPAASPSWTDGWTTGWLAGELPGATSVQPTSAATSLTSAWRSSPSAWPWSYAFTAVFGADLFAAVLGLADAPPWRSSAWPCAAVAARLGARARPGRGGPSGSAS